MYDDEDARMLLDIPFPINVINDQLTLKLVDYCNTLLILFKSKNLQKFQRFTTPESPKLVKF